MSGPSGTIMPSRIILASAGTGKTYQLTARYVSLLTRGVEPSRILATTFTRHAAGQIFDRIVARLLEAAERGDEGSTARAALGMLLKGVDRLRIGTLDSFFARLATAYATELDLPTGWRLVDDDEDERLRARAVEITLQDGDKADMLSLLQLLMSKRFNSAIAASLLGAVSDGHSIFLGADSSAWNAIDLPAHLRPLDKDALLQIATAWTDVPLHRIRSGEISKHWQKAHQRTLENLLVGDWESLVGSGLPSKLLAGESQFNGGPITDAVRAVYQPLLDHAAHALLARHVESTRAMRHLLQRFDRAYHDLKKQHLAYRFDDVPRLLGGMESVVSLEEIAFRLDGSIDHVLLDEFQDTSSDQFSLIEPLLEEILSGGGGRGEDSAQRSVFCVGDLKQSLYQWRNAEPGLFAALPTRWTQLDVSELDVSFRSSPVILSAVNAVFKSLPTNAALAESRDVALSWNKTFHKHAAAPSLAASPGFVRLSATPLAPDGVPQKTVTLIAASRHVAEVVTKSPGVTVGVLVRSKTCIPRLIFELKRLGIEASEEGGNPLTDAPAVAAALSALQLADHPGDTAAAFHVATSPLASVLSLDDWRGETSRGAAASRIRLAAARHGYAPMLSTWLDAIAPACDVRDVRRFEQLIDLADQFDSREDPRAEHLVQMVRSRRVDDPTAHPVRVMTIHASKGLEFDLVVLPDLENRIPARSPAILFRRSDPFQPIDAVTRHANEALRLVDPRLEDLYQVHRARTVSEELCVLYVAMTRARHALEMFIKPILPKATAPDAIAKIPLTHAGILRGSFAPASACEPGTLYENGNPNWHAAIVAETSSPARPEITIALAGGSATSAIAPTQRSDASLGIATIHAATSDSPFIARPSPMAVDRGTLVHAWMEHVDWLDDGFPDMDAVLGIGHRLALDPSLDLLIEAKRLATALESPEIRGVLSRDRYPSTFGRAVQVRHEVSYAVSWTPSILHAPTLSTGRIDRLVLGLDPSGTPVEAEVIDFKTDAVFPGVTVETLVQRHRDQMESYRMATARLTGLSPARVRATLVLLSAARVVSLGLSTGTTASGSP